MINITYQCDNIICELNKFSDEFLHLGLAIVDDRLEMLEKQINFKLPDDFKYIMKKHNGISLNGTEIYGIDKNLRGTSLDQVYNFEHIAGGYKMPDEFLPFSPDGRGNHYCLDLSRCSNSCPIVFWQHDHLYKSKEDVETCNLSFMGWINEVMIDWTLEDYNFDGSEK